MRKDGIQTRKRKPKQPVKPLPASAVPANPDLKVKSDPDRASPGRTGSSEGTSPLDGARDRGYGSSVGTGDSVPYSLPTPESSPSSSTSNNNYSPNSAAKYSAPHRYPDHHLTAHALSGPGTGSNHNQEDPHAYQSGSDSMNRNPVAVGAC